MDFRGLAVDPTTRATYIIWLATIWSPHPLLLIGKVLVMELLCVVDAVKTVHEILQRAVDPLVRVGPAVLDLPKRFVARGLRGGVAEVERAPGRVGLLHQVLCSRLAQTLGLVSVATSRHEWMTHTSYTRSAVCMSFFWVTLLKTTARTSPSSIACDAPCFLLSVVGFGRSAAPYLAQMLDSGPLIRTRTANSKRERTGRVGWHASPSSATFPSTHVLSGWCTRNFHSHTSSFSTSASMRCTGAQKSEKTASILLLSARVVQVAVGSAAKFRSGCDVEMLNIRWFEMGGLTMICRWAPIHRNVEYESIIAKSSGSWASWSRRNMIRFGSRATIRSGAPSSCCSPCLASMLFLMTLLMPSAATTTSASTHRGSASSRSWT